MADAQSLNATFFAFRKREGGGVLLGATLAYIIGAFALTAAFAALSWPMLVAFISWYGELIQASTNPEAMANIGFPGSAFAVLPLMLLWMFLVFVLYASYEAACQRWLLRGETGGLFGLTLGADTWRVYAGYWVWFGLYLVGSTALSFLMMFLIFALTMAGIGGGANETEMGLSFVLAMVVSYALYYGVMIYFAIRFAPAAATSVARRRFAFFDAWQVTRGRFWALFGSFFLVYLINFVVGAVLGIVAIALLFGGAFAGVDMATMASDPGALMTAYVGALTQVFSNPTMLAIVAGYYAVAGLVGTVVIVLMFGINARAVQAALEDGKIQPPAMA